MLKIAADAGELGDACFDMVRAAHPDSPLDALIAAVTGMAQMANTPEELANSLAFLQIDISDPEFHVHTLEMSKKTRRRLPGAAEGRDRGRRAEAARHAAHGPRDQRDRRRLADLVGDVPRRDGREVGQAGSRDALAPYRVKG